VKDVGKGLTSPVLRAEKPTQVEREMAKAAKGRINARKDGGALAKLSTRGAFGKNDNK
jgi:hypothetical protein